MTGAPIGGCNPPVGALYLPAMWTRTHFLELCAPPVLGMIHLDALPGAPRFGGQLEAVTAAALADARALAAGGVRLAMVENFHDVPFWPDGVPPETVAAMAVVLAEIRRAEPGLRLGVNVLRNDAAAALGLAAATGAVCIRVNVHTGAMVTDQGPLSGQAHRTLRQRAALGLAPVGLLADLRVKHAAPLAPRELVAEAQDLRLRGLADALIVSGEATGAPTDPSLLAPLRHALPDCPLLIGSGVTADTVSAHLAHADGVIVGTSLKTAGRVDADRVRHLVAACGGGKDPA